MSQSPERPCPVCGAIVGASAESCRRCGERFTAPPPPPTGLLSWPRAIGLSLASIYGPFLAMAMYMTLFVSCGHCKRTAWTLLPFGPAVLPLDLAFRAWLRIRLPDWASLLLSLAASAACLFVCVKILRHCGWGRIVVAGLLVLVNSYLAFVLVAMIRA